MGVVINPSYIIGSPGRHNIRCHAVGAPHNARFSADAAGIGGTYAIASISVDSEVDSHVSRAESRGNASDEKVCLTSKQGL